MVVGGGGRQCVGVGGDGDGRSGGVDENLSTCSCCE